VEATVSCLTCGGYSKLSDMYCLANFAVLILRRMNWTARVAHTRVGEENIHVKFRLVDLKKRDRLEDLSIKGYYY